MTESNQNSQIDICPVITEHSSDISMEQNEISEESRITHDQLAFLVDIFYLPFEYGEQALQLLEDFQFMHKNANIIRQRREMDADIIIEWNYRFERFQAKVSKLEMFFRLFLDSPNRSLVQELFSYVVESHSTLQILSAILEWMKGGNLIVSSSHNVDDWWKNRLMNVEPWSFGNGLLPDLQKLVISSSELANLFLYKNPIPLLIASYQIKPLIFDDLDHQLCYDIFAFSKEKNFLERISSTASANLFFDRCFGIHFKSGQPQHSFQINQIDSHGNTSLFAVITSIFSLNNTISYIKTEFKDTHREKYSKIIDEQVRL
jgi:hypothetical protein